MVTAGEQPAWTGYARQVIPGPDLVIACPNCGALARVPTLASGNTFVGKAWTDGKATYPMLPDPLVVSRCPSCARIFFLDDAPAVGELDEFDLFSDDPQPASAADLLRKQAPRLEPLGRTDWLAALAQDVATTRIRVLYLRLQAWWASNDPFRDAPLEWVAIERREAPDHANALALLELLEPEDTSERLLKAELLRELGCFPEALELARRDGSDRSRVGAIVARFAGERIEAVQRVQLA